MFVVGTAMNGIARQSVDRRLRRAFDGAHPPSVSSVVRAMPSSCAFLPSWVEMQKGIWTATRRFDAHTCLNRTAVACGYRVDVHEIDELNATLLYLRRYRVV